MPLNIDVDSNDVVMGRWAWEDDLWLHWLLNNEEAVCTHKYENVGGVANGETATDYFRCTQCGHEINHTYY